MALLKSLGIIGLSDSPPEYIGFEQVDHTNVVRVYIKLDGVMHHREISLESLISTAEYTLMVTKEAK